MQTSFKKYILYLVIVAVSWLPVHVAFAASLSMPTLASVKTVTNIELSKMQVAPVAQVFRGATSSSMSSMGDMMHCDMPQADCCSDNATCNQMDCSQCVSFVALAQQATPTIHHPLYRIQYSYHQPLMGLTTLSAYRPPRRS